MNLLTSSIAAIGLISATSAQAQSIPSSVSILVEALPTEALSCGVTEAGVEAAARSALRYNRVVESIKDENPYLYIRANVIQLEAIQLCIANVSASLRSYQFSNVNKIKPLISSTVVLCENGGIMSRRRPIATDIYDAIKMHIDQCLSQLAKEPTL